MPYCRNCGNEVNVTARFCSECGQDESVAVPQRERIPAEVRPTLDNSFLVDLPPQEVLDRATTCLLGREFIIAGRTENTVTVLHPGGPDMGIGCLLLCLFLIPGIIYLVAEGDPVYTTVYAMPEGERARLFVSGHDRLAQRGVWEFFGQTWQR